MVLTYGYLRGIMLESDVIQRRDTQHCFDTV